ncbi:MAG TPA: C1 family peptidase [Ferruginibacter sp.]|nr:C1 family peptidase [Ferruginibacter sp.]
MKKFIFCICFVTSFLFLSAQDIPEALKNDFSIEKANLATAVKNQGQTGTCWSFSTTSLLESQLLKNNNSNINLSEMFTVRNIYLDKATNYVMRQGAAQFGEGGLGHNVIEAIAKYGSMPEEAYSGLLPTQQEYNHSKLMNELKIYLDSLLKHKPLMPHWQKGVAQILDKYMGAAPDKFNFEGKEYTAKNFAVEVLKFNASDYVNLTSFTHKPFYEPFIIDIPDNFSNGSYYNIPMEELIKVTKAAINNGFTVLWDADVSNNGFRQKKGLALYIDPVKKVAADSFTADMPEAEWNPAIRQKLFENLTTQDDHLMHITGLVKTKEGKEFFTVKNSWGNIGPYNGLIEVSGPYFAINTISLVMPKAALSKEFLARLKLK